MTHPHEPGPPGPGRDAGTAWLRRIVDGLPVGLAVTGPDGRRLYANRAADVLAVGTDVTAPGAKPVRTVRGAVTVDGTAYDVAVSADATEQRKVEDDLFRRAYFDDLTGLPNRRLLERGVEQLITGDDGATRFALAFIDLDGFKHINDYYGHDVGDQLLVKIAERITRTIRASDLLARVGGDELLLLIAPAASTDAVTEAMTRILERLKEPFFIDGHEIFSSASIGVSLFPEHGRSYSVLRVNADSAMYRIKADTKGGVSLFDPHIGHAVTERMKVEQRLRTAIRDRRLCCAYQPKVDFRGDKVVGLEVLLRWRDEGGVIQAPGNFVDLAVELGLMNDITLQVLAETVAMTDLIDEAFGPEASISINVAAKQATDVRFMRQFADALAATGDAGRFMVELTEEAFVAKTQFQTRVLPMLRDIGTRVSIDDFGVGFSSLSALADITADEIKVDRSFITAVHKRSRSQSILGAIESLGQSLGMSVIVEGVETFEELTYLQTATRIRYAQGFYFSKPVVFDEDAQGGILPLGNRQRQVTRAPVVNRNRLTRAC